MRAYSKSGSEQTHFMVGPLSFKLKVLAKQVSQDFMHSFLGLIALGTGPFQHRAAPTSGTVSGLSQAVEVR